MQQEGTQIDPPEKGRTHSLTSVIAIIWEDPPDRFGSDDRPVDKCMNAEDVTIDSRKLRKTPN
jgi:hypothetical protein